MRGEGEGSMGWRRGMGGLSAATLTLINSCDSILASCLVIRAEVRVLHEIQLVDGIDKARVQIGQHVVRIGVLVRVAVVVVVARRAGRLQLQIVQRQRVGVVIELIKVAAVQREIRAAEAVVRIGRIVCKSRRIYIRYILIYSVCIDCLPSGEKGKFGLSG